MLDSYIQNSGVKSILAVPLLHRGYQIGLIYLENKSIEGCFTQDRVHLIRMISTQAALSVVNARLYAEMEQKVAARTLEAEQKMAQLEAVNKQREREIVDRQCEIILFSYLICVFANDLNSRMEAEMFLIKEQALETSRLKSRFLANMSQYGVF